MNLSIVAHCECFTNRLENFTIIKMSAIKVTDLKEKLKSMNLLTYGSKAELVKRLLEAGLSPEELKLTEYVEVRSRKDDRTNNILSHGQERVPKLRFL